MGRALATGFAKRHEVLLGSRDANKGEAAAEKLRLATSGEVRGGSNAEMSLECDVAVLVVPDLRDAGFLEGIREPLSKKMVISPIVPMRVQDGLMVYGKTSGSAAEDVASILTESRVVAALHHVPALTLLHRGRVDCDVMVACDDKTDYERASRLISDVDGLRPLYVGPLSLARSVESITPLLVNSAKLNQMGRLSLKLVE